MASFRLFGVYGNRCISMARLSRNINFPNSHHYSSFLNMFFWIREDYHPFCLWNVASRVARVFDLWRCRRQPLYSRVSGDRLIILSLLIWACADARLPSLWPPLMPVSLLSLTAQTLLSSTLSHTADQIACHFVFSLNMTALLDPTEIRASRLREVRGGDHHGKRFG